METRNFKRLDSPIGRDICLNAQIRLMRRNRKYYVLAGIMIGVGVFGLILTLLGKQ